MAEKRIYYANGEVALGDGRDWYDAQPDYGVLHMREDRPPAPGEDGGGWYGVTDRLLWTGEDEYDPWGWGVKLGAQVDDDTYWLTWIGVAYDGSPPDGETFHPDHRE